MMGGNRRERITRDAITTRPDLPHPGWALSARLRLKEKKRKKKFFKHQSGLARVSTLTIALHIRCPKSQVVS